jgi:hypothetical protein
MLVTALSTRAVENHVTGGTLDYLPRAGFRHE